MQRRHRWGQDLPLPPLAGRDAAAEFLVIRDARPAAEHHYLVLPLTHTPDVKHVTAEDLPMLRPGPGRNVPEPPSADPRLPSKPQPTFGRV